jgi:hypothetical protein
MRTCVCICLSHYYVSMYFLHIRAEVTCADLSVSCVCMYVYIYTNCITYADLRVSCVCMYVYVICIGELRVQQSPYGTCCMYVCVCMFIYTYMCVCICVRMHFYIYIYRCCARTGSSHCLQHRLGVFPPVEPKFPGDIHFPCV